MPIKYARRLTGSERSRHANRHLGFALAFVAGAANAGGFLAVQQYTSHMTGIVSAMADNLVLGATDLALGGLGGLFSFLCGAMTSAILINFSRRRQLHSEYALPLLLLAQAIQFGVRAMPGVELPGLLYFVGPFIAAALWLPLTFVLLLPQYQPIEHDANRPI